MKHYWKFYNFLTDEFMCFFTGNPSWQVKHTAASASSEYKSDTKFCASSSFELQFPGKEHPQSSVAIEFRSLDIPTNSTIQDARITFYSSQTSLDDNVTMEISITNPEGLSSNFISSCLHKDIGNQALVQPVIWHLGQWMSGSRYTSPNISHLIQYLISYSSWSRESIVVLVIRQFTDSAIGSARHVYSHKSDTGRPKLSLYYTSQNPGKKEIAYFDHNFFISKGLVIINTWDRGGRKFNFFSKKLVTHPTFASSFHTPSENLPKLSYPNMYKLFMC